ncbi:hypothetical protein IL992_07645 [Microbispora sp. NEAU-D428]|uniref:hypothetical protein n=1 Tax=Microbispora sitophila TaxID=2771537 RepID=UPI001867457D|nr:hypothetical protein [Microbispora sitophila]MBE3009065.1 hypothetical protein [Microbispora sitophila]
MVTALDSASALRDRQWADYESRRLPPTARLGAVVRAALWLGAWGSATKSPSARVRADAYQAYVRQFTGLDHGGKDDADRQNGRRDR